MTQEVRPRRSGPALLLALAIAFIATMTLQPATGTPRLAFGCIICGGLGGVDFLLNIVLFVPLGISVYWLRGSWKHTILIGLAVTLAVEALQWRVIPGRDASLGDLVSNVIGTAIGASLGAFGATALHAAGRLARNLSAAFALLASFVVVVTSWMLQPIDVTRVQSVQWKASRENMDDFSGDLQSAELNGVPIYARYLYWPRPFMRPGTREVGMQVTVGGRIVPTVRQAIILRLADLWQEAFLIGQWGDAAIVRSHQVAQTVRFRPLLVALDGGLADAGSHDGGSLTIEAVSNPRAVTLTRTGAGEPLTVTVRRTAGLGWTLFLPWDVAVTPRWWIASAAWLAALVIPVAFFTGRSRRHVTSEAYLALWPLVVTLAVMTIAPRVMGLSILGIAEWAGVAFGLIAGSALEKLVPTAMPMPLNPVATPGTIQS